MKNNDSFVQEVLDRMAGVGAVQAKKMFGGHGIYCAERMFALVADNQLYLKVDDLNRAQFEAEDLPPFSYTQASGKVVSLSYHLAPEVFFDDAEQAKIWADHAWQAALRAPVTKKTSRRKT